MEDCDKVYHAIYFKMFGVVYSKQISTFFNRNALHKKIIIGTLF